ncbi:MAG: hypothetical protein JRH01_13665 [Deltaproteobacteria bacterium]|nr:hypothetical protein [Deltaproteobacteria bacterium]MBW2394958.1 hypothetical protein [Deltaproteobacteria bacterium]
MSLWDVTCIYFVGGLHTPDSLPLRHDGVEVVALGQSLGAMLLVSAGFASFFVVATTIVKRTEQGSCEARTAAM